MSFLFRGCGSFLPAFGEEPVAGEDHAVGLYVLIPQREQRLTLVRMDRRKVVQLGGIIVQVHSCQSPLPPAAFSG